MLDERAPAKINLFLHVTGRRPDGYHLLDSLAVFAGAHDRLTAAPAETLTLSLSGPFAPGLAAASDNLVLRAAGAFAEINGVRSGAALKLQKNLPVASGIGGGSADAAATLRLLTRLWGLDAAPAQRHALAARLGADVPVCLASQPARMSGVGEVLDPAPALPPCGLVLVNPGVALSTPAVFGARRGGFSAPAELPQRWTSARDMAANLAGLRNDLEAPALALCPAVGHVLNALRAMPGCLLARMSGSGATCFALISDAMKAREAALTLARPGWWVWGGALYDAADGT